MCDPTGGVATAAIVSAVVSAAGAVATQDAQRRTVNKQQDALAAQAQDDANTRALQMNQVSEAAAEQANDRSRAAQEEAATFAVVTGEYGGGVSAERGDANIAFHQGSDLSTIQANRHRNLSQLGHEGTAGNLQYRASLAAIDQPSSLGTSLKIVGAGLNAYGSIQQGDAARADRASRATNPKP